MLIDVVEERLPETHVLLDRGAMRGVEALELDAHARRRFRIGAAGGANPGHTSLGRHLVSIGPFDLNHFVKSTIMQTINPGNSITNSGDDMRGLRLGSLRIDLETFELTRLRLRELMFGI